MGDTKLVCLDFDQTIVNGHFHSTLASRGVRPNSRENGVCVMQENGVFHNTSSDADVPQSGGASPESISSLLNSSLGPKNPVEMANMIRRAIDNGHKVAVTSFTLYPEVIIPTLKHIGLEDEYIRQIGIVGGFPAHGKPNDSPDGKEQHIQAAMTHFNRRGANLNRTDVMLVDDTKNNLDKAVQIGKVPKENNVLVPKTENPEPTYFDAILKFVSKNLKEEVPLELEAMQSIVSEPEPSPAPARISPVTFSASKPVTVSPSSLGLAGANLATYPNRPGNVYLKFNSKEEMDSACVKLRGDFGESSFRVAGQANTLQIYDQVQNALGIQPPISAASSTTEISPADLGLDKGKMVEFKERPGKVYVEFSNPQEREAAHKLITQAFGEGASRLAGRQTAIEINDRVKTFLDTANQQKVSMTPADLGLDKGNMVEFKDRPGKTYVDFKTPKEREAAHKMITQAFGEGASRLAGRSTAIEINDKVRTFLETANESKSRIKP